uniref:Uncharacterized protein n=1 Tax=Rhizophora mucronata TaxID=61149 RepID=A0A2P2Q7N6_RHIMU
MWLTMSFPMSRLCHFTHQISSIFFRKYWKFLFIASNNSFTL